MAGKDNVIGLAMGLDVTDLKAGINEVKKLVKQSKDEFNVATAGLDKWTKSADGLTAKLNQLDKQLDAQNKVVAGYKAEIERVSKLEGDHSVQLEQLKSKLQKAEIEVKKTESSIAKYSNSLSEVNAENKKAESSFGKLTSEIEKQKAELSELEYEYKDAVITYGKNSKEAKSLAAQINKLSSELNENENEVKQADNALEKLEKQFDDTADEALDFSDILKGNLLSGMILNGLSALGSAVKNLAGSFKDAIVDSAGFADEMMTLSTQTGLSTDKLQEYKYMSELIDVDLETITGSMAKLTKNMATASKGTGDSAAAFEALGIKIKNADGSLRNNQDVFNDTITALGKMENETQRDAYAMQIFGKSAQELNPLIAQGGDALAGFAKEAHDTGYVLDNDTLSSLGGVDDGIQRMTKSIEGIKNNIVGKFAPVITEFINSIDFQKIGEQIENAFAYFIDTIIPAIVDGFTWIIDNKDILITGIVAIGTAMLAWNTVTMIQGVVGAIKAWTAATEGATLAQKLFNAAQKANLIGIIISLVVGLVAAFITLWKTSDKFRNFWINLWKKIQDTTSKVIKAIGKFFSNLWKDIQKVWGKTIDWFKNIGSKIADGFKNATSKVKDFFSNTWNAIKNVWSIVISWFVNIGTKISNGFKTATNNVKNFFVNTWNNIKKVWSVVSSWFSNIVSKLVNAFKSIPLKIKTYFSNAWNNVKKIWSTVSGWFANIKNKIVNAFKSIPSSLKNFFVNAWNNIKNAWKNPTKFFSDVKNKIINSFKELPNKMLSVGKNLVEGLWNGIKDMSSWIIGKIKGFTGDVLGGIKKFFGIHSPSKETAEIGKFLDEGLVQGIEKNKRKVTKATDKLGQDILSSISGIEKELEKKNIAEKIVALGGKVENPFASWTWSQLDSEAKKLEEHLDSINQKIIKNGVTQEEWGTSQDKINERAKLLEERLIAQNKLIEVINARLPKTINQDVKSNYEEKLNKTQEAIEVTMSEFGELENKITSIPEKMSFTDKLFTNIGEAFGHSGDKLNEFVGSAKDKMKELGSSLKDIFSQGFDAWNESINKQIEALDKELEKFKSVKDAEIEKNKSYQDEQLAILESALASGNITEKTFQLKKQQLEKDTAKKTKQLEEEKRKKEELTLKKKNELAKKQFNAQKANDIAQAVIQGALAILKGFAQLGPIGGAINAGIQGAITGVQIATIASQKFVPMLAKGGVVDGATLAMIGEDGKEAVVPLEKNTGWIRELAEKLNEVMQKDFSLGMNVNQLQPAFAGATTVNNYYYQTINSPKQLSRKEIYRDTKNLLSLRG